MPHYGVLYILTPDEDSQTVSLNLFSAMDINQEKYSNTIPDREGLVGQVV
jgi:hypothetical protein